MDQNSNYIYTQSGVLPIYDGKIVIITSRKKKRWIIPKGIVEPNMTPRESAQQEAYEEAGLVGKIKKKQIGKYRVKKWDGICTVEIYPMIVEKLLDDWEEKSFRKRKLVFPEDAASLIKNKDLKEIILNYFHSN